MGNRRRSHAGSAHPPRRLRVGCLNVCGCNQDVKKGKIGSMFEERNLDVLALSETKLKGKGEEWFGNVWGVKSGVSERTRAREGVAILLKQELWEYVIECKKVNSRLIWVKLKVDGERWVIIGAYAPGHEKKDQERQVFWEQLNECVSGFDARDRVIVMGDLNAKVSNVAVEGIIGIHGVFSVVNGNGEELVDLCAEKGLMIGNTWFKKRDIHKYTYVSRRDGQRALLDYVLIDRRAKERLLDVNVLRGATGGMSDHYLVEAKVKICMGFQKRRVNVGVKRVVRVSELEKETCVRKYQERLSTEWKKVRTMEVRGVGEEWDVFRESVMDCAKDACGMRRVGDGLIRKGSEWWDEEVRVLVKEKREAFGRFLQGKNAIEWEMYKRKRQEVKRKVQEVKKSANESWGERVSLNFRENKKMFWKEVNKVRKTREQMGTSVKGANGEVITSSGDVKRWSEYFEGLLNVFDDRVADIGCFGRGGVQSERVRENDLVNREEVVKALRKMKAGKAAGLDSIAVEFIKKGGDCIVDWLVRLFNVCMTHGEVPEDWRNACIVPLYKGKGDKNMEKVVCDPDSEKHRNQ
ncbi:uncharacterized protein [Panulirus ornatus]|uniref:uncharacterized protein n=1 Tax=Panulirus ornatus TaxID=150431 RepID=UPI003A85FA84